MSKFYSLDRIIKHDALYNVIFGERSNGKTSAVLELILKNWVQKGEKGIYLRRYDEEIKGARGNKIFASIANERDLVRKYTKDKYETIIYYNRAWYLAKFDETLNRYVKQSEPFCYAMAISQAINDKGGSMPEVTTVCFDEFLNRKAYLVNEFVDFTNVISTIVRQRGTVRIYMLGNTVNKFSPYFDEMGLFKVAKMKPGTLDLYEYGDSKLTVAVEYCESSAESGGKKSDKYFAFDNPKLKMITTGEWELPLYPHAPFKIPQEANIEAFYIQFRGAVLQGNIVVHEESMFIYIHMKTTPLVDDGEHMIYKLQNDPRLNYSVPIIVKKARNKVAAIISDLFKQNQVYFQNNNIGELVRNYVLESDNHGQLI